MAKGSKMQFTKKKYINGQKTFELGIKRIQMKIMRYYFNDIEKTKLFPWMKRWKADIFIYSWWNVIGANIGEEAIWVRQSMIFTQQCTSKKVL